MRLSLSGMSLMLLLLLPGVTQARPVGYDLEAGPSKVAFATDFEGRIITGEFPVSAARLALDFDRLERSSIAVLLDVAHAKASFPFAAEAMRGPSVLDAGQYPAIRFESTGIAAEGRGARVTGNLTIRGVTRQVVLKASLHRQKDQPEGNLDHLTVRLTGAIRRSDFGADGYAGMVGDEVRLDIRAQIARSE
jgi:polyisoprenoid-binding protein YceI